MARWTTRWKPLVGVGSVALSATRAPSSLSRYCLTVRLQLVAVDAAGGHHLAGVGVVDQRHQQMLERRIFVAALRRLAKRIVQGGFEFASETGHSGFSLPTGEPPGSASMLAVRTAIKGKDRPISSRSRVLAPILARLLEQLVGGAAVAAGVAPYAASTRAISPFSVSIRAIELVDRQGAEVLLDQQGQADPAACWKRSHPRSMGATLTVRRPKSISARDKYGGVDERDHPGCDARGRDRRAGRSGAAAAGLAADCRGPARAKCWSRSPPPGSTGPTCCSAWGFIRRRPAPATSPGWRSPARWSRRARAPRT